MTYSPPPAPHQATNLEVLDRRAKVGVLVAVVLGLALAGLTAVTHSHPSGTPIPTTAMIAAILSLVSPLLAFVGFTVLCGAVLDDGSRRCLHRRRGLFQRCGTKTHVSSIYDLWAVVAGASLLLDAWIVIPLILGSTSW
jgi:hypothetical protein